MDSTAKKPIFVIGSSNYGIAVSCERLPDPAETLIGNEYRVSTCGNGAEQALALQCLGADIRLLSRVGQDPYGQQVQAHLKEKGLDLHDVSVDPSAPTSLALLTQVPGNRGSAVMTQGATATLSERHVDALLTDSPQGALVLASLDIPQSTLAHLLERAKQKRLRTVLHASPFQPISNEILQGVDLLVLTPRELQLLTGRPAQHMETAREAAKLLLGRGVGTVLVMMDLRGVLMVKKPDAWPSSFDAKTDFVPGLGIDRESRNNPTNALIAGVAHHLSLPGQSEDLLAALRFGIAAMAVSMNRKDESYGSEQEIRQLLSQSSNAERLRNIEFKEKHKELKAHAGSIRRRIIRMLGASRSGHPGGSLSIADLLSVLYFHTMNHDPKDPSWVERDRLVLSKGHAAPALYSVLMEAGTLDSSLETELRKLGSPLQGHPDLKKCTGVDMSTGSLGQGLSVANGMALAARHSQRDYRVYAILGDGEMQEGQVWEAAMTAAHQRLDNICAILDFNALQIDGCISQIMSSLEPVADKWRAFGWNVMVVDGHDLEELVEAFETAKKVKGKPTMIVAHTVKGRGVSFMQGVVDYHGSALSDDEVERALAELEGV